MKILKNTLERITRHWIRPCSHKGFGVASHYILWSGSSWYPVRGSTLRNKQYFFISNFKINGCFLDCTTWCSQESYQLNVTKNNSRSLRRVIKSSSAPNFEMFAHSPTLISRFAHFISNRWLWIAEIIFTLIFLVFPKIQWFFLDRSSLTYIILRFIRQSYKTAELKPLWISD